MERNWLARAIFVLVIIAAACVALIPTFIDTEANPWAEKINDGLSLGLDLKGGIHFVLSVDTEKAATDRLDRRTDEIRIRLDEEKIPYETVKVLPESYAIDVTLAEGADKDLFRDKVIDYFGDLKKTGSSGNSYTLTMRDEYVQQLKVNAVDQTLETLRSRIDELGLKEPQRAYRYETGRKLDPCPASRLQGCRESKKHHRSDGSA